MAAPRKPAVMSPAGYWPQLRIAIEAGADSVYFGLKHFTARAKACARWWGKWQHRENPKS
jgi:putative protease